MTFNPSVPNAAQSPGLFPPQNSTNFTRLKTLINADHVFNDTAQTTDGVHRQCTMIARAMPVGLPVGTNSILYSWLDTLGRTQLRFYNGATDVQLTPPDELFPIRIVGSANVVNNAVQIIYPDPGFSYEGSAFVGVQGGTIFMNVTPVRWLGGTNSIEEINHGSAGDTRVPISFVGNNLTVKNKIGSAQIFVWSLIINRTS